MRTEPAPKSSAVRLRNGSKLSVRSVGPNDKALLQASFAQMSDEARYRRFMTTKDRLTDADLRRMTELDHLDSECILAFDGPELVASASYFRDPTRRHIAEVAIVVADGHQRRGIATALGRELARRARREGIRRFEASMLASNQPAISLLRSVHRTPASQYQGDLVRVEFTLTKLGNLLALAHRLLAGLTRHSHAARQIARTPLRQPRLPGRHAHHEHQSRPSDRGVR